MRKFIKSILKFAILGSLLSTSAHCADLEPLSIRDFSCGLVTSYDPTVIDNGCSQQLWNVDLWTGRIQKRRGSLLQNSTPLTGNQPVRFMKAFPDQSGNKWLISVSSNSIFSSNNSGATNNILTSTYGITANSIFGGVNAFGKIRLVDGSTNAILFDGSNLTISTASPKGNLIAFMFERVFMAGVAATNSTLYISRFGDPEDWTPDGLADNDALQIFIRQNDGFPIRALVPFGNTLLIFKDRSIDALTMDNSGLIPIITAISNNIGTAHPGSIQVRYNDVIFMGPDGFYSLFGNTITPISTGIKPTFDLILQKNSTSRSLTLTTKSDFDNGTSSGISTSILPNSLVLSTWSAIDTSSSDFISGTLTNMTTNYRDGAIAPSTNTNSGFETGNATGWSSLGSLTNNPSQAHSGSYLYDAGYGGTGPNMYGIIWDTAVTQILYITTFTPTSSYAQYSVPIGAYRGQQIIFGFRAGTSGAQARTNPFIVYAGSITFYARDFNGTDVFVDDFSGIDQSYFVSRTFFSSFTRTGFLPLSVSTSLHGNNFSWYTQTSTNGSNWGLINDYALTTPNTDVSGSYERYILTVDRSTGANVSTTVSAGYIDDVTLSARASIGNYKSAVQTIGTNINSWGTFSSGNTTNGGSIQYTLYTDSDTNITLSNSSSWLSSQTIISGQIPTFATAPYLIFYTTVTITASTQAPQVDDLTIAWGEGSTNFPVSSLFYEGDYLISVATKSTSNNDTILVYDRANHWTMYTGLNLYSMTIYNQQAYGGDAVSGNIYRIQVDNIYSDNGASIYSFWKSKEFDFGYMLTDKTMRKYFITAKYNTTSTLTFSYGVNRGATTSASLTLSSVAGFFRTCIAPSSITYKTGITHSLSFSNNVIDQYFDLLAIEMYPRLETPPGP